MGTARIEVLDWGKVMVGAREGLLQAVEISVHEGFQSFSMPDQIFADEHIFVNHGILDEDPVEVYSHNSRDDSLQRSALRPGESKSWVRGKKVLRVVHWEGWPKSL